MPASLRGRVDLVFSNVPYISPAGGRRVEGWDVPLATIFGPDADGLGLMRDLVRELPRYLRPGGLWVFQVADDQLESLVVELANGGFDSVLPESRFPGKANVAVAWWRGTP
jgi:release factor glutamine methyltransferase